MSHPNPLRKRIGIVGGGQLGRMMIEESLRLNIEFNVLDAADCSCASLATKHIVGSLTDATKIRELAEISDVLTFEIEHVNVDELLRLEAEGKEIIPSPGVLQIIRDKGLQKQFYADHGIPSSTFQLVETEAEWRAALQSVNADKIVAKSRRDGYDGKGVSIISPADVLSGKTPIPFQTPSLLETFVPCEKELSVMVARDREGHTETWPVVEMVFDPVANLVTFLDCPSDIPETIERKARDIAHRTIDALGGVGVFAVELFLTKSGEILVNEVAPRPHNSGHHTIEACYTSQFEQLVRILAGLPLGDTGLIQPAVMMNLLGGEGFSGSFRLKGLEVISKIPGVYVHLYGKRESKPFRKMGHITIIAETLEKARKNARLVADTVSITTAE